MKGARGGVHFTAVFVHEKMKKRRNEEGEDEKRRLVSFYILSVSLVKKESRFSFKTMELPQITKVYTLNSNVNISIQRGEQVQISSGLYCRTQKSVYL